MQNPDSVLVNETYKMFWDFEIQTDHSIPGRILDLMTLNKKENLPNSGLRCPDGSQNKNQRK